MNMAYGDLQIEEDMAFQAKTWKAERVGWVVMALIALASILGLTDKGPLSKARKGEPQGLSVEYQRFLHIDAPAQLHIRLPVNGPFAIQLPFEYLSRTEVLHVVPEPREVASHDGLVTYSFLAQPGVADVQFDLKPRRAGSMKGFVQRGGERVDFAHFVYP